MKDSGLQAPQRATVSPSTASGTPSRRRGVITRASLGDPLRRGWSSADGHIVDILGRFDREIPSLVVICHHAQEFIHT